jgi:nucleoside-diphosphate-sugar epimerase
MHVMVTGGAGFGGSGLVRRLLERGHRVTVVDVVPPSEAWRLRDLVLRWETAWARDPRLAPDLRWLWKAVHDLEPEDLDGVELVVHMAAQADVPMGFTSPRWTAWQNVMGTLHLLETCAAWPHVRRVILAGSAHELEAEPERLPMDETSPLEPATPYGFTKAAQELAFRAWARCYRVPVVVMSNGVVVGPGMRREIVFYKWFRRILEGVPVDLEGGDQTRDVTYVDDVVDAWIRVIEAGPEVDGQKFQVSYGEEHSMRELLEWCFQIAGRRVPVVPRPYRPGERGMRECFSIAKARAILGYQPQVPPYEALRRTYAWVRDDLGAVLEDPAAARAN